MIDDIRRDSVTCLTEQGVGDSFWTYQKIAPFYKEINFILGGGENNRLQRRAEGMLKLLPKVESVTFQVVDGQKYNEMATAKKKVKDFLDQGLDYYEYSVSQYYREGIRIEEIEPGMPLAWNVPLPTEKVDTFDQYISLTASGLGTGTRPDVWSPQKYINLINLFKIKYGMPKDFPVVVLGASFDEWLVKVFASLLNRDKVPNQIFVDHPFKDVFYLLKNSTFFFGYQSGLNLLADNMNVPQLMIWFNELGRIPFTFAKRSNIAKGVYNATFFSRDLQEIVDNDIRILELPGGFKRSGD
jgi:hypothetical protein